MCNYDQFKHRITVYLYPDQNIDKFAPYTWYLEKNYQGQGWSVEDAGNSITLNAAWKKAISNYRTNVKEFREANKKLEWY